MSVRVVWYWFAKNRYEAIVLESRVNNKIKGSTSIHPYRRYGRRTNTEAHTPPRSQGVHHTAHRPSTVRILQQNSLAQHWARDWRALALTQVHHCKKSTPFSSSPSLPPSTRQPKHKPKTDPAQAVHTCRSGQQKRIPDERRTGRSLPRGENPRRAFLMAKHLTATAGSVYS